MIYLRNLETGEIKTVERNSAEFHKLTVERTEDGRFPLYEQTGAHDADPKEPFEVEHRSRFDAKLHDVTTDGVLQSGEHQLGGEGDPFAAAASTSSAKSSSGSKS